MHLYFISCGIEFVSLQRQLCFSGWAKHKNEESHPSRASEGGDSKNIVKYQGEEGRGRGKGGGRTDEYAYYLIALHIVF
jgi:hypothetical protein